MTALTTTLLDLPTELLVRIYDYSSLTSSESWQKNDEERKYFIDEVPDRTTCLYPMALTNRQIWTAIIAYWYNTTTFHYHSPGGPPSHSHYHSHNPSLPHYGAAPALQLWLRGLSRNPNPSLKPSIRDPLIQSTRIQNLRKLSVTMSSSELLWLFAPPHASRLLGLPREEYVDRRVRKVLRGLRLNELGVGVVGRACPGPCEVGVRKGVGVNPDGSSPTHYLPDHRWVIKAVLETLQQPTTTVHFAITRQGSPSLVSREEIARIMGVSWESLHGSSIFHECETLFANGERLKGWAHEGRKERDGEGQERRRYRVPIVF